MGGKKQKQQHVTEKENRQRPTDAVAEKRERC